MTDAKTYRCRLVGSSAAICGGLQVAGFDADVRIRALAVIAKDHSSWSTYIAGEILQSESRHEPDLAEIAWSGCGNNTGANGSSSDFLSGSQPER